MNHTFHHRWPCMGTWFEAWLVGDDFQHLEAVAGAVVDEVRRVERRLNRFDPTSELSRINREAAGRAVLIDFEMLSILQSCFDWWRKTDGRFDIAATSPAADRPLSMADVLLDGDARTLRFAHSHLRLDLGGWAKGYALDRLRPLLREFQVNSALVHGGTSSVLAVGCDPQGNPWPVGVFDPLSDRVESEAAAELVCLPLCDRALSCSAVRHRGVDSSDLRDPASGQPLTGDAACLVLAAGAADAEALSTGLLCMGKTAAQRYTECSLPAEFDVFWIDCAQGTTRLEPWTTPPSPV